MKTKDLSQLVVDYVNDKFPTHDYAATSVQNPNAEALLVKNKKFIPRKLKIRFKFKINLFKN